MNFRLVYWQNHERNCCR